MHRRHWIRTGIIAATALIAVLAGNNAHADNPINLALHKRYTLDPAPNYALCRDPGDSEQLTDGKQTGPGGFWTQASTVGWQGNLGMAARITIDLESVQPIERVTFSTASRLNADVVFPSLLIAVSDDGKTYHLVRELIGEGAEGNQAPDKEYRHLFVADGLKTRGRYVMLTLLFGGSYAFLDEVEVFAGTHDPAGVTFTGKSFDADHFRAMLAARREAGFLLADAEFVREQAAQRGGAGRSALETALDALRQRIQALSNTMDTDMAGLRAALNQASAAYAATLFPGKTLVLWARNPWLNVGRYELPLEKVTSPELSLTVAANEYESASFLVSNVSAQDQTVRVDAGSLFGPNREAVPPDQLALRRAVQVTAANRKEYADALVLLPPTGFVLPAGQTAQIWLTLRPLHAAAGSYHGKIRVRAGEGTAQEIPLRIRVLPVNLPEQFTVNSYNWAYVTSFPLVRGLEKEAADDLRAHYTNTFVFEPGTVPWPKTDANGNLTAPLDFTACDRVLELHRGARQVSWFWGFVAGERPDGGHFGTLRWMSEPWKKAFRAWLTQWIAHLQARGLGYDDFFMYPFDETVCPQFAELAAFIKEVDPRVRLFADPIATATADELARIRPYIDIWCPHLGNFVQKRPEDMAALKATGKTLWTYSCEGPAKALPPYDYYRLKFWRAWQEGMTGAGFWAYADAGWDPANAWDDFDGARHDYAVIYTGRDAPAGAPRDEAIIPSKRWEAWREGVEEYELLNLLRAQAESAPSRAAQARAAKLLQRLPKQVLAAPDNPAVGDDAHRQILETLAKP